MSTAGFLFGPGQARKRSERYFGQRFDRGLFDRIVVAIRLQVVGMEIVGQKLSHGTFYSFFGTLLPGSAFVLTPG